MNDMTNEEKEIFFKAQVSDAEEELNDLFLKSLDEINNIVNEYGT